MNSYETISMKFKCLELAQKTKQLSQYEDEVITAARKYYLFATGTNLEADADTVAEKLNQELQDSGYGTKRPII